MHSFIGGKNVERDYRGGARFECEQFSEFQSPPPAVNNDHSLIGLVLHKTEAEKWGGSIRENTLFPKGNGTFLKLPYFWGRVYTIYF